MLGFFVDCAHCLTGASNLQLTLIINDLHIVAKRGIIKIKGNVASPMKNLTIIIEGLIGVVYSYNFRQDKPK